MVALGAILLLIGLLGIFIFSLAALVSNWRYSPELTLLTFIPVIGVIPSFMLLFINWQEMSGVFSWHSLAIGLHSKFMSTLSMSSNRTFHLRGA